MKKNKILKIAAVVLLIVTTAFITRMYTVKEILGNNRDFGKVILMEDYLKENYLYNKAVSYTHLTLPTT